MTCTITGYLRAPDGSALPDTAVTIHLQKIAGTADGAAMPKEVTATSNGSGLLTLNLLPGIYRMRWHHDGICHYARLGVPDELSADLSDLIDPAGMVIRGPEGPPGPMGALTPDDAALLLAGVNAAGDAKQDRILAEAARDAAIAAGSWAWNVDTQTDLAGLTPTLNDTAIVMDTMHVWRWDGAAWVDTGESPLAVKADAAPEAIEPEWLHDTFGPGKNLVDPAKIRRGRYFSPSSGGIATSTAYRCTGFIPVVPGQTYRINGTESGMLCGAFELAQDSGGAVTNLGSVANPITIPANRHFLVVNITDNGQDVTTWDGTVQVERGPVVTAYEPWRVVVKDDRLPPFATAADVAALRGELVEQVSHNLIDPTACDYTRRHSTGSVTKVIDAEGIAGSAFIPVEEGVSYVLSGTAVFTGGGGVPWGGYYAAAAAGDAPAVQNITWGAPPQGSGYMFTVPIGLGINFVVINLWKAGRVVGGTSLDGVAQLEIGEVATEYQPYELRDQIKADLLPEGSGGGGAPVVLNDQAWLTYVRGEAQPYNRDRWPVFSKRMLLKDQDVCVVSTGTSLTARSTEHHSDHPPAKNRPPLMHSRNLASHIWDALSRGWEGQRYARYDDTAVVTEAGGGWATSFNLSEWDDGAYRNGLTRYTTADGASVAFEVPAGTWAWRFIHRTDSVASTALAVAISGGNGIAQVYDEATSSWIEANGYTFSQREAAPSTRSVSIPNPDTDAFAAMTIASAGNTTYQKRLKLRFVDRSTARTVTITNTVDGTRFNYWGAEWSPRQFMLTYINASRGSHNTQATQSTGLPRFADNEVHSFRPDLIFGELPIHNDGAAGIGVYSTWDRWGRLTNNYVWRADYELSLATRATNFGYTPEFGWWTPSIAYGFSGISEDGKLLTSVQSDGRVMTALDKFDQAVAWVREHHPEAVMIHAVRRWVEAGIAIYGDLRTATDSVGKAGPGMTNDGGHANDVGDAILAKLVVGPLDFGA